MARESSLVRFGLAIDEPLLADFDALVKERGCTRSELFRDLARAEVGRAQIKDNVPAVASLTIVYDHHVRDLSERLNELQHELGDRVRATLHIHLNHDLCLEVIVLRGQSDELRAISEKILATRGVKHGGVEIISESLHARSHSDAHASRADFPVKKAHPARPRSKKKHKH
ncbi:MAG TPA: nickel-responsive transcriptional regulator NikR [Polyangiaceae bacterium]|jgi:CopG family nickel-responsive transcriptional regulator|nr:nickel-responsive transcriptional regulator NikR [Polyangiaceae bacterium]